MKQYHTILLDIDGTLLDFDKAEQNSIREILEHYGLRPEEKLVEAYHTLNQRYWHDFEIGNITKDQIMGHRFTEYFQNLGENIDGDEAEAIHRKHLNESAFLIDGALEICAYLKEKYDLYVVTNGVSDTQYRRLKQSGLDRCFRAVFVSEDAGSQKPQREFFDYCFSRMEKPDPESMLIVGDSLTSDIKGGNDAGIDTCWYNPSAQLLPQEFHVDYEIRKLKDLEHFL